MKLLWTTMVVVILLLQVRLWVGEGSFAQVSVEERARMNLGLIRDDETFFLVVEN